VQIETVLIDDLDLDPRNARKHDEKNLKAIADSLKLFGQRKPIVVWGRTVVAGNGTMAAAQSLGWTEISVARVPDDWSSDQVKAYALADNRSAELAVWDEQVLASQLLELTAAEFDVELLGFEIPVEPLQDVVEDDIPEQVEPKSKLGDVWQLGKHRLVCGDATDTATVEKLMGEKKANLIFTDPPYGVDYKGINNDDQAGLENLLRAVFQNYISVSNLGCSVYVFHSDKNADIFHKVFREFFHFSSMIIWFKNSLTLSQTDYQSQHEPCMYGWAKNGTHNWYSDRKQVSVWQFEKQRIEGHTTPKPTSLIANAIKNSSKPKQIVVDLFGGSGSTLIACEQTDRVCFMMELDPKYVDVIIARWEKLTGQTAELIEG
jgi:site-specific DNA-methyltransferase (adenine-specific)